MSYAIIKTGGKQYKVKAGEILKIEKLPDSKPESKIEFTFVFRSSRTLNLLGREKRTSKENLHKIHTRDKGNRREGNQNNGLKSLGPRNVPAQVPP